MQDTLILIGAVLLLLIGGFAHMMVRSYREERRANRRNPTQLLESQIGLDNWRMVQKHALVFGAFMSAVKIVAMFYAP